MQATPLRSVMSAAEYQKARDQLQEFYGDPDAKDETLLAKRDQAFAELFYHSGWTQVQLAEKEGKTQPWVTYRLRFGRFLSYSDGNITTVINLTERSFRSFWERTEGSGKADEASRFDEVIRLMQEPPSSRAPGANNRWERDPSAQVEAARKVVRPLVETGMPIRRQVLEKETGATQYAIIAATYMERGRIEALQEAANKGSADDLADIAISKSAQEKLDRLEARLRAKMEAEFQGRLQQGIKHHIDEYLMPVYRERLEKAELVMKTGKPFTDGEFKKLLWALHPDTSSPENRHEAFVLLKEKEVVLRPPEKDRPLSGGLPQTLAELLARRKSVSKGGSGSNARAAVRTGRR